MIRVELYEMARRLADREAVEIQARTLGEALAALAEALPALVPDVLADGRLVEPWRVSVNGREFVDDPATPLADGDALVLVSALAGG